MDEMMLLVRHEQEKFSGSVYINVDMSRNRWGFQVLTKHGSSTPITWFDMEIMPPVLRDAFALISSVDCLTNGGIQVKILSGVGSIATAFGNARIDGYWIDNYGKAD